MKFRTHLLAGLIAAVAAPAIANATPYVDIGELQQRAQMGLPQTDSRDSLPGTVERKQSDHSAQWVSIGELQQRGEMGLGLEARVHEGGRTPEFFAEHQRAMNVGVSHIEASQQAAREVAKADQN